MRGILNFFDVTAASAFDVKPEAALAYFKGKGLRSTFDRADIIASEHDTAFTVSKMMDIDLLKDVKDSLDVALSEGVPFNEWSDQLRPLLEAKGWWGRKAVLDPVTGMPIVTQLGSPGRLKTIFRTNLQSAYAAGQWVKIMDQAKDAPYLMYDAVDDYRTRDAHRALDNKVLPVTDKFWRTHYPPLGYNCRCGTIQLSGDDLEEMGLTVDKSPRIKNEDWTNPRTGKVERVPVGVDPGFNHNPGMAREQYIRQLLNEKVRALPDDIRPAAEIGVRATAAEALAAKAMKFDQGTPAGQWHGASWEAAPEWLQPVLLSEQAVELQMSKGGAWARAGKVINMSASYAKDSFYAQDVWRHEFGHILDVRIGAGAYISGSKPFTEAMQADAKDLTKRLNIGIAQSTKAKRAAYVDSYIGINNKMADIPSASERRTYLEDAAKAIDIDLGELISTIRLNSDALNDGISGDMRLGRILHAIKSGDPERFIHEATGRDTGDIMLIRGNWKKGQLGTFSDLFGAATKNKVANAMDGYYGHSNAYYNQRKGYGQQTEAFANLTALAGGQSQLLWELAQRFMPRLTSVYQEIIRNG